MKLLLTSILLFTFTSSEILAQQAFYIKKYTTDNGLTHNNVRSIIKDKTGFIWLATFDGLSRFDGYEFRNYRHIPDDTTSIPNFNAQKICVDSFNNIWAIFSYGEITKYNRAKDNFIRYKFPSDSLKKAFVVSAITTSPEGEIWIAGNSIKKYSYKNNLFETVEVKYENGIPFSFDGNIGFMDFDNNADLWINNDNKVIKCRIKYNNNAVVAVIQNKFPNHSELILKPENFFSYDVNRVHYISQNKENWVFSSWGLFKNDSLLGSLKKNTGVFPQKDFFGKTSFAWADEQNSLNIYYPDQKELLKVPSQNNQPLRAWYIEENRNIWLSRINTSDVGQGLIYYHSTSNFFKNYTLNFDTTVRENGVVSVLKDRYNNLWVSDLNFNYIIRIKPNGVLSKENILSKDLWTKANSPRMMIEDSLGIWFGYSLKMLTYFNHEKQQFNIKLNNLDETILTQPYTYRTFLIDGSGNLIIGDLLGKLYLFNPSNNVLKLLFEIGNEIAFISLQSEKNGGIWFGCSNSTILYLDSDYQNKTFHKLCETGYNVVDICAGDNKDLWIALLGGGICHFEILTGKKEFFTTGNGLSNNTTYKIQKDKKGFIWISTNQGISRLNPKTKQFRNFGKADGLKIEEFNSYAGFQTPEGEMFFGGMGGLVSFYPDSISNVSEKYTSTPLIITDIKVSGLSRFFEKAIYDLKKIRINKGDNNFSVTFSCIDFQNADKIMYRYKLNGNKNDWVVTDHTHRYINYENLSPGNYNLEIEATNLEGDWVNHTSVCIVIPAFYYQTVWFKLLLIMVLIASIISVFFLYISRIRLNSLQVQNALKLESLRGQMNPHFIFNSLNSINYFISQNDQLSANRYIADFSRLIRSILNNTSLEFVPMEYELQSIRDYLHLEHLRFGDKFDFIISIDPLIDLSMNYIFPGLVQPFIENAIWHGLRGLEGRKGSLIIRFEINEINRFYCFVEDDGVGRKLSGIRKGDENHKQSKGIKIVQDRLKIFNQLNRTNYEVIIGDKYTQMDETGTIVKIEIPLKNNRIIFIEDENDKNYHS